MSLENKIEAICDYFGLFDDEAIKKFKSLFKQEMKKIVGKDDSPEVFKSPVIQEILDKIEKL